MKASISLSPFRKLINHIVVYLGFCSLAIFLIFGGQESRAANDYGYIVEDFEGNFVSMPGYGSIPSGWSVDGPQEAVFSKGVESHHGQYGLHAAVTYDPTNYTLLEAVLIGAPGTILNLQIQAKAATSGNASARLAIPNKSITRYWYSYSSTDWFSMTLEDIEIPSNGELNISLMVGHDSADGSTDFDFDCLTSSAPLTIDKPDDKATVTGVLTLPAEANGREYIVIVDTDTDGDNGFVASTIDTCGTGLTVDYSINDVPAGTYYIYAYVFVVSETAPPQEGDYIGFYGTGIDPPDVPNAFVPLTGVVTFDIALDTMGGTPVTPDSSAADDYGYIVEDFEGGFVSMPGYGSIPSGWSVDGPQEAVFSKDMESHHGQYGLHAAVTYDPTEYTLLEAVLKGDPGTILNLQIQAKAATSGNASARLATSNKSTTRYWYSYSSTDWISMTLEDIEIPSSGELNISLMVGHDTTDGSTDFDFDCLTSNAPLTIDRPDDKATVTGVLTLPAEANGREHIVIVDTDTNGDNGFVASTINTCGTGLTVDYSINGVPAGTYYVYACVFVVSETSPPQDGDYIGFYGTGIDPPDVPNAFVPLTGIVTFDIALDTMGGTPVTPGGDADNADSSGSGGGGGGCFLKSLFQ